MREKIIDLLYAENVRSDCGIERLADEICAIDPMKWTTVSERLPKEEYEVLVTTSWHDVCIAWYDDGKWRAEYINEYDDDEILAWMPLPEPWRGEEDE